jgi:hypothetical protein
LAFLWLRWQLQHRCLLAFYQGSQKNDFAVCKFQRIVMGGPLVLVDRHNTGRAELRLCCAQKSPVGSCGARNERLHQRAWSAKLQFGFYERWSPRDCASASRWQMPRSEGLPLRLDWTNSTRLTNVRDNRVGSLERKRLSRRRSPQPVGGSQGGIVRLWPRAHRDTVRRATATSHGTLAAAVTLQGCGTD